MYHRSFPSSFFHLLPDWGDDVKDENAGSVQAPKDISATAGYTTFVGEGLIIDHPISLPCSKTGGCNSVNKGECMVDRCTDAQIDTEGYKRIELAIPPGGPSCSKHSLWEGYITLKCSLLSEAVFGQNRGELYISGEGDDSLFCIYRTDRFFVYVSSLLAHE